MTFPQNKTIESKRYTWSYKIKYAFFVLVISIALVTIYSLLLEVCTSSTISKNTYLSLIKENFNFANYINAIFPHIIFYMLFEELAFRKSLVISRKNLIISLPLLLYLSFQSFLAESNFLFIYGLYALIIIILYKKANLSKWLNRLNSIVSVAVLAAFHVSKFSSDISVSVEFFSKYLIPMLLIGLILAHIRLKFNSYWSFAVNFVIIVLVQLF